MGRRQCTQCHELGQCWRRFCVLDRGNTAAWRYVDYQHITRVRSFGSSELFACEGLFYNMTWSDQVEGSMSRVISHMALERFDKAVEALRTACRNRNPLAVFMHVWPILDPLRERDDRSEEHTSE